MFKIESYITPILLSYVDKYIKNFRPEDSQVSLWGGDACFHNLDLRLEVLEEELQLPFSFVSGHIHELLFHVPWTKLASEPITITINTIECILKLRTDDQSSDDGARTNRSTGTTKEKRRRRGGTKEDMVAAPPGYVQTLINKIVNNITIFCNNLILKYVEEDIVLSVNIKTVKVQSANEKWEPAFTEISQSHCMLRKLITLSDLTICLDKRNSSGKIEMYQEPLLYRCVMEMHLLQTYHSIKSKTAAVTRIDLRCFRMDFSLTEQQIPMLMRLFMLAVALQKRELQKEKCTAVETVAEVEIELGNESDEEEEESQDDTWADWAWSWMPSLMPAGDDSGNPDQQHGYSSHILHLGVYIDLASISFKVTESTVERSYYGPRKVKFIPFLVIQMNGAFVDVVINGPSWFNLQVGLSFVSLEPCGDCFCGELPYLSGGSDQKNYLLESLFDANAIENKGEKKSYNVSWDFHIATVTETLMLEKSPVFAFDLVYMLEIPEDISSERLSELESDLENSNLSEHSLMRLVVGPLDVRLRSGLFHRLTMVQCAASLYDYDPYSPPKPEPSHESLQPVSMDDFEALEANIPKQTIQLTLFKPTLKLYQSDHPVFDLAVLQSNRKRRKSSRVQPLLRCGFLPCVTVSCQCLDAKLVRPMYPQRLVGTVCQLPEPPEHMFDACHMQLNLKLVGMISQLQSGSHRQTVLLPSNLSYNQCTLLYPALWQNHELLREDRSLRAESITSVFTKPQFLILLNILQSTSEVKKASELLQNTSLLSDAFNAPGTEFLELSMDGLTARQVYTADTVACSLEVGAVKAFVLEGVRDNSAKLKQVQSLVLSGPDFPLTDTVFPTAVSDLWSKKPPQSLLTFTAQGPLDPNRQQHPPLVFFNVHPVSVCIDPLLWRWLLYVPGTIPFSVSCIPESCPTTIGSHTTPIPRRTRRPSEASSSHRSPNPRESVHSSSDREQAPLHLEQASPSPEPEESMAKETEEEKVPQAWFSREQLLCWFPVWRGLVISGDIAHCTIYLPTQSLSAVGASSIEDALSKSMHGTNSPDVLVICFPFMTLRSSSQRQGLHQYSSHLPVQLPENVWMENKVSFPWSMSLADISIYTIQKGKKLYFLKPCTATATVGISTKNQPQQNTLTSLGLCVHVDGTPIILAVSEEQVSLMMSVFSNLSEVQATFSSVKSQEFKSEVTMPSIAEPSTPVPTPTSPTIFRESSNSQDSPAIKPVGTEDSSEKGVPISFGTETVKVTAWMQCTLARLSVTLYAIKVNSHPLQTDLKLTLDMEDIMTSFDIQQIYVKAKLKVASANVRHFKRCRHPDQNVGEPSLWVPGPYLGLVMQAHEESSESAPTPPPHASTLHHLPHHRDSDEPSTSSAAANGSFLTVTFTRASCGNVHSRWGATQNRNANKKQGQNVSGKSVSGSQQQQSSKRTSSVPSTAAAAVGGANGTRFINEIVVKLQAMDFVLSPSTLGAFLAVVQPGMQENSTKKEETPAIVVDSTSKNTVWLCANNLPLVYLDTQAVRVIIPANELMEVAGLHNVCMLQFENVTLSPQVENPLSRVLVRPDIYHWAEQAGILRIPGSGVEDRQYQLDVSGLNLSTGTWSELERVLARPSVSVVGTVGLPTGLRTMSENPALEWNQLQSHESIVPHVSLLPVVARADLCIVAAPAIVLEDNTLVCGHSLEVNALKDIEMSASTRQLLLGAALSIETLGLLEPLQQDEAPASVTRVCAQHSSPPAFHMVVKKPSTQGDAAAVVTADSGVESVDISSASNLPEDSVSGACCHIPEASSIPQNMLHGHEQSSRIRTARADNCVVRNGKGALKGSFSSSTVPIGSSDGRSLRHGSKHNGRVGNVAQDIVPVEILFTSGSWSCLFYEVVDEYSKFGGFSLSRYIASKNQGALSTMEDQSCAKSVCGCDEDTMSPNAPSPAKQTRPLLYLQLVQPHTFVSCQALTRKIQVSCFDVSVRTAGINQLSPRDIPAVEDFKSVLLETRGGDPHPGTGIPPSFLTVRWSRTLSKPPKLDVNMGRPTKVHISLSRINYMASVQKKLFECIEDIALLSQKKSKHSHQSFSPEQTVSSEKQEIPTDFRSSEVTESGFEVNGSRSCISSCGAFTDTVEQEDIEGSDMAVSVDNAAEDYASVVRESTAPSETISGPAEWLHGLSAITISTEQIVIAITAVKDEEVGELLFNLSGMNGNLSAIATGTRGVPERISAHANVRCLTVTTKICGASHLLLNPWSFNVEGCVAWEAWHLNSPLVTLTVDSDCIFVDLGPDHLRSLLTIHAEYASLTGQMRAAPEPIPIPSFTIEDRLPSSSSSSTTTSSGSGNNGSNDLEQQYRDDLRAGAFQFVDAVAGGGSSRREEMPLPYQVVFSASPPTMAWRYPQPRALTRVEIFPVPFKVAQSPEDTLPNSGIERVLCELQCWSEVRLRWLRVVHFELSESETRRLQLKPPVLGSVGPAARMWRVRLAAHKDTDDEDENTADIDRQPTVTVCPRTLAACMRVDSFFSPALVPRVQVAVEVAKIEVSFQNHVSSSMHSRPMPPPLSRFTPDGLLPDKQTFAVASVGSVSLSMALWQSGKCSFDVGGLVRLDIIDYAFLTQHCALEPFRVQAQASITPGAYSGIELSCVSQPISLRFGAALAHTLAVSMQLWAESLPALAVPFGMTHDDPFQEPQVLLTRYVICNDTNRAVRFGQASTDEDLLLSSRQCHLYSWRSQKVKRQLRVSVDDGVWAWSKPFYIDAVGVQILPLDSPDADDVLSIVIKVSALSATQRQITITGQLIISNILSETFECKILPETEGALRQPQYLIAAGNSTSPTLLLSAAHNVVLRIRFKGLNSIWSGDIPLKVSPASGQPWLVKVPLMERGQFLSVWCRVFHQNVRGGTRVLAMLCPLYMIRSHLPVPVKVSIETPGLKVTMQTTLAGRGERQQLYCPGTIDHSHRLMLQLEQGALPSNPYVPLSYSMIDEQSFFRTSLEHVDVDHLAENPTGSEGPVWPFVNAGLSRQEWKNSEEQLQTFVQVAYRPLGPHCASLLVELRPWALLVNTLGVQVAIQSEDHIVCSVLSPGVAMPPRLESTFHLLMSSVSGDRSEVFATGALQLARNDWDHLAFYMPHITGLIPQEGRMMVTGSGPPNLICVANLQSSMVDEIRILHIRPSCIFVNAGCFTSVRVALLATHKDERNVSYQSYLDNIEPVIIPAVEPSINLEQMEGTALVHWTVVTNAKSKGEEESIVEKDFAFYVVIDIGHGWSCPLYVGGNSPSRIQFSVPSDRADTSSKIITETFVLTFEEKDEQVLLTLHPENHPQILVYNKCNFKLVCAQGTSENNGCALRETEHLEWWCIVPEKSQAHYNLPDTARNFLSAQFVSTQSFLVFALVQDVLGEDLPIWSYGIDVNEPQERFLYLPGHGDVRVSLHVHCHTAYISVETVSHVEISARDIRARLLEHGSETESLPSEHVGGNRKVTIMESIKDHDSSISSPPVSATKSSTSISSYNSALDHVVSEEAAFAHTEVTVTNVEPRMSAKLSHLESDALRSSLARFQEPPLSGSSRTVIMCFIKGFNITLLEDLPKESTGRTEVIVVNLDDLCISIEPGDIDEQNESQKFQILVGDLQIDNQMYQRGGFDFPVILMGQPTENARLRAMNRYFSLSAPAQRLIEQTSKYALLQMHFKLVIPRYGLTNVSTATHVRIIVGPLSAYIEDTLIMYLMDSLACFFPGVLVMTPEGPMVDRMVAGWRRALAVKVLREALWRAQELAMPLRLHSLAIEPLSVLLSMHTSVKLYIALEEAPLQFNTFERKQLITTPYRLGHALTMHYLSGALFGLGWVVGSLELLGAPGGFARELGLGLRDFFTLPFQGIFHGPWAFLVGISHGSASLMRHITAGTLTSVTKLASSVARNLDRLTLDHEHLARAEEQRRHRPQGLTEGLMQGLAGFGISILGAVGGIAHHPIQTVMTNGPSPGGLVASVGRGLVGVVTKPLSGAAELVARAGEGLLYGAGWASLPEVRHNPIIDHTFCGVNSHLKYAWKLVGSGAAGKESLLFVTEATAITPSGAYEAVALVLCTHALFLVNLEDDTTKRILPLVEVSSFDHPSDPTLVCFQICTDDTLTPEVSSHDRVVDFVRRSTGLVHGAGFETQTDQESLRGTFVAGEGINTETPLTFFVNPQSRSYFLSLFSLIKRQCEGKGFTTL
ncbi:Vacuolar protein sorting-associated protein 13 [Gryllus bimaculatus]|nr:Vacuolar protein sorting-associated protein 13 [Gryllus bimaculatus]